MTSPTPERGVSYSLSVHGEPPEGVEVLWKKIGPPWWPKRSPAATHWMLAPEPAPEPAEEPPFPLSREEWDRSSNGTGVMAPLRDAGFGGVADWWKDNWLGNLRSYDYDTVVSAWHAAGCPGAVKPEAPEGEAEEGPWSLKEAEDEIWPRVRIFGDIGLERFKQDQKWGDQSEKGDAVFCAILGEEFGEVCQAFLQEKPTHEIREELVQTAAVAVQWIEILDRRASHAGEGE